MHERLYRIRPDPAVFETGIAQSKQLLLSYDVNEISLHWFASNREFVGLQQIPMEAATMPPGHRLWQAGKLISEGLRWEERVQRQLAALKEQVGFVACEILVRNFESEVGAIDLPAAF